jgi:hypothetical protein
VWDRLPYYAQGMVGLTSYGDVPQPQIYFYVWYVAAGCAVLLGIACLSWRHRVRLLAIVLGSYVVLAVPDINAIHHGWYLSQGRYALPFVIGAPLLAGYLLGKTGVLTDQQLNQLAKLCAPVLLPFQFVALWFTMIRFDKGVVPGAYPMAISPFHGRWTTVASTDIIHAPASAPMIRPYCPRLTDPSFPGPVADVVGGVPTGRAGSIGGCLNVVSSGVKHDPLLKILSARMNQICNSGLPDCPYFATERGFPPGAGRGPVEPVPGAPWPARRPGTGRRGTPRRTAAAGARRPPAGSTCRGTG